MRTLREKFVNRGEGQMRAYHEQLASLVGVVQATQLVIELAEQKPEESKRC
jgi:hypothetical protein